jgi:Uri superfamily endonuclease
VGALGQVYFEKGLYAYVGSAQANLEKRVARHLRKAKRKFWHVDYLLDAEAAKITKVFWKCATKDEECAIAYRLGRSGRGVKQFGCSDCKCTSHLFRLNNHQLIAGLMNEMLLSSSQEVGS